MLRRILLPTLLAIALLATVGIASATVERSADDSVTSTTTAEVASTTMDDSVSDTHDDSTTITTMPSTTSTTLDDHDDDFDGDSTTSTTIEGAGSVPDGVHVIDASTAGSVTVAVKDGVLSLVSVDITGDWWRTNTEVSAREIELEFENEDTELEIEAEIEDGRVKTRVEFQTDDESDHDSDHD